MHVDKQKRDDSKFDARGVEHFLMGFKSNGYLLMDPQTRETTPSCNVDFKESKCFQDVLKSLLIQKLGESILESSSVIDHNFAWVHVAHNRNPVNLLDNIPDTLSEAIVLPFTEE